MSKAEFGVDFPEEYPMKLRGISWTLETAKGGVMAGPMKRWNKNLDEEERDNPLFVENVVEKIFEKHGLEASKFTELIQYIARHLSVYYSQDSGEFIVREKTSGDERFDAIQVNKMTYFNNIGQTNALIAYIEKSLKGVYDKILKNYLKKCEKI